MSATVDNLTYTLDSPSVGLATLTGTTHTSSFSLVIPDTILVASVSYTVTYIATNAFLSNTNITSLVMSNNITATGTNVFQGCSNMTSAILSTNLSTLNNNLFLSCTGLTSITTYATHLGSYCFGHTGIVHVGQSGGLVFQNPITYTNLRIFENSPSLLTINLTAFDGIALSNGFAENCYYLTNITSDVGTGPSSIGNDAFKNAISLTSVVIPTHSNITINNNAFYLCSSLQTFSIGDTTQSSVAKCTVADSFNACNALTTITGAIYFSTSIGTTVIFNSPALTEINLYWADLTSTASFRSTLYPTTLSGSCQVTFFDNNMTNSYFTDMVSFIETNWTTSTILYHARNDLTIYTLSPGVNTDASIHSTTQTSSITIPSTLTVTSETTVVYNVVAMESGAFENNTDVSGTLTFPNSVTTLGSSACSGCTNLTEVVLPSTSLTVLPANCFRDCTSLSTCLIPTTVTTISEYCFSNCSTLAGLELPSSLTTIGTSAFNNSGITSVVFSTSFSGDLVILDSAFYNCSSLDNVYLFGTAEATYSIGNSAFDGCNSLTAILFEVPNNLVSIGSTAVFPSTAYTQPLTVSYYYAASKTDLNSFQQSLQTTYFDLNPNTTSYDYNTACFGEGTLICCYDVELQVEVNIPVEDLQLGDLVKTYLYGYQPVCRQGKSYGMNNSINPARYLHCLYTMKQDGNMTHDLSLVGGHSILVDTLSEETRKKQEATGFSQQIDDKWLQLVSFSDKFEKHVGIKRFTYYHFALGTISSKRYGVYANGTILCEIPSPDTFDTLESFKQQPNRHN